MEREKNDVVQGRVEQAQQETGGCVSAGDGDPLPLDLSHSGIPFGDDQRTAAASQRSAGTKKAIVAADKSEQMVGYLGDIELPADRQPVEGLDVLQPFAEAETGRVDQPVNQRVKYECVIGAGRIA